MKKSLFRIYQILIFIVIIAKISNLIFHFSDEVNKMLNSAMFTLIGISYLAMAYVWTNTLKRILIASCGLFLIVVNFFAENDILNIIGIVCLLTPMIIARFYKEENSTQTAEA